MQYLRNLQSQLSQSLWIRSHREPNIQGDFNYNTSNSNISIISSSDNHNSSTPRFSTSSSSTLVPHFVDLDIARVNPTSYHKDNSIATVVCTSGTTPSRNTSRKLSLSFEESCVAEIKSAFTSNYNNNNGSNNNSSLYHQNNRVCSSAVHRDTRNAGQLICPEFKQHQHQQQLQTCKRRNSSYSSSSAGRSDEFQPVILSLTPLSKSIKREYCKTNDISSPGSSIRITSLFHPSTSSSSIVLPKNNNLCSSSGQFKKKCESWEKSDTDECLKDSGSSNNGNKARFTTEEKNLGENKNNSCSSSSVRVSTFDHRHSEKQDQEADHEKQSLLNSNPLLLLQLLESSESEIVEADENNGQKKKKNKEEKVAEVRGEQRKRIAKSEERRNSCCSTDSSTTSNTGIDDEKHVLVDVASPETNDSKSRRKSSISDYLSNSSGSSSVKNNFFFVVKPSSIGPGSTTTYYSEKSATTISSLAEKKVSVCKKEEQERLLFFDGKGDGGKKTDNKVGSHAPRVNVPPPPTSKNSQRRSSFSFSSSAYSTTAGSSRSLSQFRDLDETPRQAQSCQEGNRSRYREYGQLRADRESTWSNCYSKSVEVSEKSLHLERVVAGEDKDIQEPFKFRKPVSRSPSKSSSTTTITTATTTGTAGTGTSAEQEIFVVEAGGERRTSPDQSCPSSSSRFTTFTRDTTRSASTSSSTTDSGRSSRSSSGTLLGSPVSSVSDLASVVLVTTASPEKVEEYDLRDNTSISSAPVVISPSYSSSSISTLLSQTSTQTGNEPPLSSDEGDANSITSGGYSYSYIFAEGLSCSQKVNQRKKSISNLSNNGTTTGDLINIERGQNKKTKRGSSIIQHLLCTKGFNLFDSPKKLLSVLFRRRSKRARRKSASFSPSNCSSSGVVTANNSNSINKTYNSSSNHRRFRKRARRRRALVKLTTQVTSRAPTKTELRLWATMDHEDLIRELPQIEKLSNQERLRLAHKRRMLQLKKFQQYEKDLNSNSKKHRGDSDLVRRNLPGKHNNNHHGGPVRKGSRRIRFRNSIMLLEAAGRNDVEEVRLLLESGVNPDVANEDGLTALHQCCIDDNEEMMKLLLEYGANVNAEDSEKWTPLHAAATCGHLHLVQYLIARNANLLAVNAEGNMPYDICDDETTLDYIESEMAKRGVTQELIEEIRALPETKMLADMQRIHAQGGDLECRDVDGATPLHIASANGYYRVAEFLLDNHAATDVQDKDFWQPIHAAACWGHLDVLELLVQNGADLDARTKNNETPYAICEDPEIKERIIQLRTEQQTKRQNEGRKRPSRTHSTNSRTQSIRRTSQRDKGLTSKRDAADEAQMLRAREELHKENSPSPTADVTGANKSATSSNGTASNVTAANGSAHQPLNGDSQNNVHANGNGNASSEEDPETVVLPPHVLGRDSVGNMKMKQDEMNRLREIAVKSGAINHNNHLNNHNHHNNTTNSSSNGGIKMNNLLYNEQNGSLSKNHNNLQKNLNTNGGGGAAAGNGPVTVLSSPDDNGNLLPKPEINPTVDNKLPLGGNGGLGLAGGMSLNGSRENLVGLSSSAGNSTIDIHVSVTINTNSPVSTLTNGNAGGMGTPKNSLTSGGSIRGHTNGGPHSIPLSPGSIFTPPGTLSDLKKQRSLIRTSSNPLTNGTLTNLIALPILPTTSTPASSTYSPSLETFKPIASSTASSSNAITVDTPSVASSPPKSVTFKEGPSPEQLVPLSPSALLMLQKNNQKNTSTPASFTNSSQSSASSWHYYWNDWRNGFSYSQSQFDSSAFSSNTLTSTCSSSNDFPSSSHLQNQQQPQQHQPTSIQPGNNNKAKETAVGVVGGRGSSIVGGVPVLPTSATSSTLFPLGSYYFNSSVSASNANGNGGGGGNGGASHSCTIPYDSSACSYNLSNSSATLTNTNNNPFSNNQHCCYLNNLTGGINDAMTKYPPASPTMSLRRFVGDPSETVGDGGKRCCVIV